MDSFPQQAPPTGTRPIVSFWCVGLLRSGIHVARRTREWPPQAFYEIAAGKSQQRQCFSEVRIDTIRRVRHLLKVA